MNVQMESMEAVDHCRVGLDAPREILAKVQDSSVEAVMSNTQFAVSFIGLVVFAGVLFFALPAEEETQLGANSVVCDTKVLNGDVCR